MIGIVDYGMGNSGSILNMLRKLGVSAEIMSQPAQLSSATKIILPGVGAFDHAMEKLERDGWVTALNHEVFKAGKWILGVCLGMQLFTEASEEGTLPGLGWFRARTRRFDDRQGEERLRIPHMGWNWVMPREGRCIMDNFSSPPRFYFVHSYFVDCENAGDILATSHYGCTFTCAIQRQNVIGTQFHPEKSHRYGLTLLQRFSELN